MSLTSQLRDRHSPLREWFEARLPDLRILQRSWNAAGPVTVQPSGLEQSFRSEVGTAFDYRARYLFVRTPTYELVAAKGAETFWDKTEFFVEADTHGRWRELEERNPFDGLVDAFDEFLDDHDPIGGCLAAADEETLARFCYVLGLYEAHYRLRKSQNRLDRLRSDASAADHLALVSDAEVADTCALTRALVDQYAPLLGKPIVANPRFARSRDLGGADADLILDGCLIDIKTTTNASMKREEGYQLLGYLLADTEDEHRVTSIGFYRARVPALISWPADDVINAASVGTATLEELRVEFAAQVSSRRQPVLRRRSS